MKVQRVANGGCGKLVGDRIPFQGNNIFALWVHADGSPTLRYAVFSYGDHFPMYVWEGMADGSMGAWFRNTDRWGRTTSKHQGQAYPHRVNVENMTPMDTDSMITIVEYGIAGLAAGKHGTSWGRTGVKDFDLKRVDCELYEEVV